VYVSNFLYFFILGNLLAVILDMINIQINRFQFPIYWKQGCIKFLIPHPLGGGSLSKGLGKNIKLVEGKGKINQFGDFIDLDLD